MGLFGGCFLPGLLIALSCLVLIREREIERGRDRDQDRQREVSLMSLFYKDTSILARASPSGPLLILITSKHHLSGD